MKVINLGETDSVLNNFVAQMRDRSVQKDRMRFRTNLGRLGQIFAYEISKVLDYSIGREEQPDKRYVIYYEGNVKLLISPSEEMVRAMKNANPRKVFSD